MPGVIIDRPVRVTCGGCGWRGRRVFAAGGDEPNRAKVGDRAGYGACPKCLQPQLQRPDAVKAQRKAAAARAECQA